MKALRTNWKRGVLRSGCAQRPQVADASSPGSRALFGTRAQPQAPNTAGRAYPRRRLGCRGIQLSPERRAEERCRVCLFCRMPAALAPPNGPQLRGRAA
eukprot:scaffold302423_cov39-Tisochrysis_lutea.AAC.2